MKPGDNVQRIRDVAPKPLGVVVEAKKTSATVRWDHGPISVEQVADLKKIPRAEAQAIRERRR